VEAEKQNLHQKCQMLERSNRELMAYKKQLEEAMDKVMAEPDQDKRKTLSDLGSLRRKSKLEAGVGAGLLSGSLSEQKLHPTGSKTLIKDEEEERDDVVIGE